MVSDLYVAVIPKPWSVVARAYVWMVAMFAAFTAYAVASKLGKVQFVARRSSGKCWACLSLGVAGCIALVAYSVLLFRP